LNRWRDRKVHIGYPAWDHLVWIPLPLGATALPELRDGKFFGHKFNSVHNLLNPFAALALKVHAPNKSPAVCLWPDCSSAITF
jgi:hypothetical protein